MSDAMIPDEDAFEQNQPVTDSDDASAAVDALAKQGIRDDAAEGDAIEQAQPVAGDEDVDEGE